ncbi:MAG: hypothetical protein NT005_02090 [Spirochaetes bacterium]|nr:hypothetical protein [Spirochaetota bacterium]
MSGKQRSGFQIGLRSFLWAFCILLALMVVAGVLTRVIPAGLYKRTVEPGPHSRGARLLQAD